MHILVVGMIPVSGTGVSAGPGLRRGVAVDDGLVEVEEEVRRGSGERAHAGGKRERTGSNSQVLTIVSLLLHVNRSSASHPLLLCKPKLMSTTPNPVSPPSPLALPPVPPIRPFPSRLVPSQGAQTWLLPLGNRIMIFPTDHL